MAGGVATARVEVKIRIEDILNRMEQYRPDLDEDLPRIPPARVGLRLHYITESWTASAGVFPHAKGPWFATSTPGRVSGSSDSKVSAITSPVLAS